MANTERLIEIFDAAHARPAGAERERFLAEACQDDPELMDQVRSLLESDADGGAGGFLTNTIFSAAVQITERLGDMIGRYKLLEKVGEGGCGVVYAAEQTQPVRRRVAVKVIKLGMDTKQVVARFEAERQALAMMEHTSIAKVLDAGSTETGRPYFVMELVRGIRITDYCDQNELTTKERLGLFIQVCHAIQHAHQKGVIHRDIKPSNILVTLHDGVPVPKVIDFGVAKATVGRLTEATVYTQLLHFIGTPAYMSPEQAELSGLDIDTRSDIYSLGVLLYELLTGRTPFDGQKMMASGIDAMRKTIRETEPPRPSTRLTQELALAARSKAGLAIPSTAEVGASLRQRIRLKEQISRVRGDLDWIVMKCLEKDRNRRYQTANGLAADIQRHIANEPVVARPPTPLDRLQKMVRRHKLAFAAAGAVVAALLMGLVLAFWQMTRAIHAEHASQAHAAQARDDRDRAVRAEAETRRNTYAAEINVAFHALADENNLGRARELLNRQRPGSSSKEDLRGFEWRLLWKACKGDEFATFADVGARAAAFSPDGKFFAYSDAKIVVREAASRKEVVTLPSSAETLSFAPHTNLLASGNYSGVKLWDTTTWREVRSLTNALLPSLFSPDGRWLLTGIAGGFRVWDTHSWQPLGDCPDGPQLAFQNRNGVAFSPDSQYLVTVAGTDKLGDHLHRWRLPSMERLSDLPFGDEQSPGSVAFSKDGKHLLVGFWNGQLIVYDFATLQVISTSKEHTAWVTAIAVAADGQFFLTSSSDRTLNLWDGSTFQHLVRLRGHVGEVWCVAISPDGRIAGSGSTEGRPWAPTPTTKLWTMDTRHNERVLGGSGHVVGSLDGGRRLVTATTNGWSIWTLDDATRVDVPMPDSPAIIRWGKPYDVKPDEPVAALGRNNGTIEVWHLTRGERVTAWPSHSDGISVISFSPDGKRLASGTIHGEVKIWDFDARQEVMRLGPIHCHLVCLAFSPDGKTLAASGENNRVWLWDLVAGGPCRQLDGRSESVPSVAFSPDGKLLATTTFIANEARLWEFPSLKELAPFKGHVAGVTAVAFCPDGKTLATGGFDRKVRLWNISTHQELVTLSLGSIYPTLRFSPDGRNLLIGSLPEVYRRAQVLQAPSFEDIAAAEAKQEN